jgi:hypothetical protein
LLDNDFDTINRTNDLGKDPAPWMNIQLLESSFIAAVFLFNSQDDAQAWLAITSIRIGNDPLPAKNPECAGNIDRDGMYLC